jgi:hypothetical protein
VVIHVPEKWRYEIRPRFADEVTLAELAA